MKHHWISTISHIRGPGLSSQTSACVLKESYHSNALQQTDTYSTDRKLVRKK